MLREASIYRSPLMALLDRDMFFERVPTRVSINMPPPYCHENMCIAQLMAAPNLIPSDSVAWLTGEIDSVVAFDPNADLTPADVLAAWKFALRVDPGEYTTQEEFVSMFTPETFAFYLREGRLPTVVHGT